MFDWDRNNLRKILAHGIRREEALTNEPIPIYRQEVAGRGPLRVLRRDGRRFTRLTNAFSKKLENHIAAISLHFMFYNFVRIHQTLRVTPAMAAGVTDRV